MTRTEEEDDEEEEDTAADRALSAEEDTSNQDSTHCFHNPSFEQIASRQAPAGTFPGGCLFVCPEAGVLVVSLFSILHFPLCFTRVLPYLHLFLFFFSLFHFII